MVHGTSVTEKSDSAIFPPNPAPSLHLGPGPRLVGARIAIQAKTLTRSRAEAIGGTGAFFITPSFVSAECVVHLYHTNPFDTKGVTLGHWGIFVPMKDICACVHKFWVPMFL